MYILPGEANPIYLLTGSVLWLMILKGAVLAAVVYYYNHNKWTSHVVYYEYILILLLSSFSFMVGIYSNIQGMKHSELVQAAASMSTADKITAYSWTMGLIYVVPLVFSVVAFWIYRRTYKNTTIQEDTELI